MGATKTFRSMNDRIDELVNNPLIAHEVRRFATDRERVNRIYVQGLADARRTGIVVEKDGVEINLHFDGSSEATT